VPIHDDAASVGKLELEHASPLVSQSHSAPLSSTERAILSSIASASVSKSLGIVTVLN